MTYGLYTKNESITTAALPSTNKVVIIDAGHGYPDGGSEGNSGILEKDINLKISKYLQTLIELETGTAIITRSDDNGIYDPEANTIRKKKQSDLLNRVKIINDSNADVFISIHLNKFSQSQYYGAQVFYSANNENSKILGEKIQESLIENIDNNNTRKAKPSGNNIYVLNKAEIPAVIVECGFLSNPKEEKLLLTDKYQKELAWAIYIGLINYFVEIP
jgi:N-acetylmuramoyl-L-alanine amidase